MAQLWIRPRVARSDGNQHDRVGRVHTDLPPVAHRSQDRASTPPPGPRYNTPPRCCKDPAARREHGDGRRVAQSGARARAPDACGGTTARSGVGVYRAGCLMSTLPLPNRVWYSHLCTCFPSCAQGEQHLLTLPRPLPAVGRCRLSPPRKEARARAAEDTELASERAAVVVPAHA